MATTTHDVTEAEMAADAQEVFARGSMMRARKYRARGNEDMAREYEALAADCCSGAAELREMDSAMWDRIDRIRAM